MQVALTFDDGPHRLHTVRLLEIAAAYNARLTFFVIGSRLRLASELVRRQASEGHEVGNHSWSHRSFADLNDDELRREVGETQRAISICGATSSSIRPPYGIITNEQRELIMREFGLRVDLWSRDCRDWRLRNAERIAHTVLTSVTDGAIILAHDIHATTVEAMAMILPALRASGYQLVTVSELKRAHSG